LDIIYLWSFIFGFGTLISIWLYRAKLTEAGLFLGISSLLLGVTGVVTSFYGLGIILFQSIWAGWLFCLVATAYLALKVAGIVILFAFPLYFLLQVFIPWLSFLALFATVALMMGGLDAADFSRLDVTSCMRNGDKPLRTFLVPFSRLEHLVKNGLTQKNPRPLLFSSYLLLSMLLISLSILAYFASGQLLAVGTIALLGCTVYFSIARQECAKGFGRIKGLSSSRDTSVTENPSL